MQKISLTILLSFALITIHAQEVSIISNGYKLHGTLAVPKSENPIDVALIIAGSGPTNRNGNNPLGVKCNSYKMISELLYNNGIATLRYDKRGIGENAMVNETNLSFEMYIDDAIEWVKYLKKDKRFSNIIIIGHSEGSLIGMIAAKRIGADKFISLCGAGRPAYALIEEQLIHNKVPQELLNNCNVMMDSLKLGVTVKNVDPSLASLFRPRVQPYMISWFKYDPCKEISKLIIPVMVIGGTTDIQVDNEDAELLSKSNSHCKLEIIKNMNHILKNVATKEPSENFKTYSDDSLPLSSELCNKLIEFIKE